MMRYLILIFLVGCESHPSRGYAFDEMKAAMENRQLECNELVPEKEPIAYPNQTAKCNWQEFYQCTADIKMISCIDALYWKLPPICNRC